WTFIPASQTIGAQRGWRHQLRAVYFRNGYKTGVGARTLSGLRSRQNLTSPNRVAHPRRYSPRGLNYGEYNSFLVPMQEEMYGGQRRLKTPGPGGGRLLLSRILAFEGPRLARGEPSWMVGRDPPPRR